MDVVIVGGGPIGCWTALQIRQRQPHAQIVIYERHASYQRDHVLTIERKSFLRGAPVPKDSSFLERIFAARATCKEISRVGAGSGSRTWFRRHSSRSGSRAAWWNALPQTLDIRTLDFERILQEECRASGILIVHRRIETPDEAMSLHPECTCFIAADGASSRMRGALWGANHLRRRDIYPSLDFKYASYGQPGYLRVNTYENMGHVYAENIGLEHEGKAEINLRLIVSREQYDAIPPATFKQPLLVTPDADFWSMMRPDRFYGRTPRQDFYELQALRAFHANERPTGDPVTMNRAGISGGSDS